MRKLFRRHKGATLAVFFVLLMLVAGITGTTWGLVLARAARASALKETAQKVAALEATRQSEREKGEQLWHALIAQARANRLSHRSGQRFESLVTLRRAAQLARTLNLPAENFDELRDAVIATLALPDLYLTGPWNPWPADALFWDFDIARSIYARTDKQGACSIRRVADDIEIHHLPGLGTPARPVFSRDGKFIALQHLDSEHGNNVGVHLWELEGSTSHRLLAEEQARRATFRDSQQVALAYADGSIRLFKLASGLLITALAPDSLTREIGIALHPTEPLVAVWSYFGSFLQIRSLENGKVLTTIPQGERVVSVAWHPDGRTLAVGYGESKFVRLYDREALEPYRLLDVSDYGMVVTYNQAGDRLMASSWGSLLELFDIGTGRKLWATASYSTDSFSHDNGRVAGAVQDNKLGTWQVADGREYRTLSLKGLADNVEYWNGALTADGQLLAVAVTDGIGFWELASGSEVARLSMEGRQTRVLFEPSGSLLTLSHLGLLRWPISRTSNTVSRLKIGPPESLGLPHGSTLGESHDGTVIVSCSRAVGLQQPYAGGWILHTDRPNQPIRLDPGADIFYIAVSPDGRWVLTVTHTEGITKIWDAAEGRLVKQLESSPFPYRAFSAGSPSFSPDNQWLRTGWDGGRLVETDSWKTGPQVGLGAPVFAPDSKLMAAASRAGIQLFDRATMRKVAMLEDPNQDLTVQSLFTPDGTKLLALTKANGIHIWDLRLMRRQLKELGLDWDWPDFAHERN